MTAAGYQPVRIVIAIPTIAARGDLADRTAAEWQARTCEPVEAIVTTVGESWAAGLNDAWQTACATGRRPDIFVCGSDDMIPENDNWLPPLLPHLHEGRLPAPCVIDPRFTNYGGHLQPVADGTPSEMSSFPVLHGAWGEIVFPLPEGLHYFADNLIGVLLTRAGIPCVAVPSSVIRHLWAKEGRGAGYGSEPDRMLVDSVRYSRVLEGLGVDRMQLPLGLRGGLVSDVYLEQGRQLER